MSARNPPIWFGNYKLLQRMAVGGMAEVFLAVRPGLEGFEKTFAIKRIKPHLMEESSFVRMFLFEAKLAAQLQHPNIVQIFDLGRQDESLYIAMEYIFGRDMSRVVPKAAQELSGPFPIIYAVAIAERVLDGLAYAHTKSDELGEPLGLVHRDVTPENIMVGWNGDVKILDFGIAKANSQTDPTKVGEIKGKLSYMSPEQSRGRPLDARSDLFTLGAALYEWITGAKLFTGENEVAIIKNIVEGRIYPLSYFRDDLPDGLEPIVMRALEKDPDARYGSAREFQFDLMRWLHTEASFMPTNTHLADFMKQIFAAEIERERALLAEAARERRAKTPPPLPVEHLTAQVGEAIGKAKREDESAPSLVVVEAAQKAGGGFCVPLSDDEIRRLTEAAARHRTTPESMARELLSPALRYLLP